MKIKPPFVLGMVAALLLALASASPAIADGTHSIQIDVTNNYTNYIYAMTWNGDDRYCSTEHKDYNGKSPGTTFTR